ncbi:MAG: hypothetical protein II943_07430 [Victivallales bacterium]|nr:hypothetical protein [Victivallales bacterium]
MAENDPQQRSSTSLFGSSSSSQSIQEVIRERQQASRNRRKKLFSWLLPLLGTLLVIGVGIFLFISWRTRREAARQEELAQKAANDPMRGVTIFGNEDAAFKLEVQLPDPIMEPRNLMTILHRAVGLKPYMVRLDVVNLQQKMGLAEADNLTFSVRINGNETVDYLDAQGERHSVTLNGYKINPEQLLSAIVLAYRETYGDDEDPAHPFYIKMPPVQTPKKRREEDVIDLNVDKFR